MAGRLGHRARCGSFSPPQTGPPPEWFADSLRYLAQLRLNKDGETAQLSPEEWLALRERFRALRHATKGQDTPYLSLLRRFGPE